MSPADPTHKGISQADDPIPQLSVPTHYAIREQLQQTVVNDFLGPAGGPDEELDERPRDRYIVGMLAPCFWQVGLAHFGGLIWPTPRDVKVERTEFRSAGA
jgi:hypothetical protein